MIDLDTDVPETTGTFPSIIAKNATTSTAIDGSPLQANWLSDDWGWKQSLLTAAGVTPSGNIENSSDSDILNSMMMMFGHPGELVPWHGHDDPSTFLDGVRLLPLEGQGVDITAYASLDAAVRDAAANDTTIEAAGGAYYRASDAAGTTPDSAGPWLILPDLRGRVVRGMDVTATVDPDGTTRIYGDDQLDALQRHNHLIVDNSSGAELMDVLASTTKPNGTGTSEIRFIPGGSSSGFSSWSASYTYIGERINDLTSNPNVDGRGRTDVNETRMRNSVATICVRY